MPAGLTERTVSAREARAGLGDLISYIRMYNILNCDD